MAYLWWLCALISSLLTGIHTALKCESHQAECHRLIQQYLSLQTSFQAAHALLFSEVPQRLKELESKFEEATMKATTAPPGKYRERAERELANNQLPVSGRFASPPPEHCRGDNG